MTPAPTLTTPIPIYIEAVQHTPDRDPVLIQYAGYGVKAGPFAKTQLHHTTQAALYERLPAKVRAALEAAGIADTPWGDAEVKAELALHLAEHGIYATVVDNVDPPQPDVPLQRKLPGARPDPAAIADETTFSRKKE
jgi:hypothetical protein